MLPSTIKKESSEDTDTPGSSSYKKKKESKDKASSSRSLPTPGLWALTQLCCLRPALSRPPGCFGSLGWAQPLIHNLAEPQFPHLRSGENLSGALLLQCWKASVRSKCSVPGREGLLIAL